MRHSSDFLSPIRIVVTAIVEFFQGYSMKIESKAALARVADAMLLVCVVLLAAYGLASWTSSRRGTPAQIRTSWDWLFKASVAFTLMITLLEFVVLGSRPGLIPMVTGSVLLVSALLMVVKSLSGPASTMPSDLDGKPTNLRLGLCRTLRRPIPLSVLFVLIGAPILLSARLAWGFSAVAVLAMLLQTMAKNKALLDAVEGHQDHATRP